MFDFEPSEYCQFKLQTEIQPVYGSSSFGLWVSWTLSQLDENTPWTTDKKINKTYLEFLRGFFIN